MLLFALGIALKIDSPLNGYLFQLNKRFGGAIGIKSFFFFNRQNTSTLGCIVLNKLKLKHCNCKILISESGYLICVTMIVGINVGINMSYNKESAWIWLE